MSNALFRERTFIYCCFILLLLNNSFSSVFAQESTNATSEKLRQEKDLFTENPTEGEPDLGLKKDSLVEDPTAGDGGVDLGLEEDPFAEDPTAGDGGVDLGLEEDPFAEDPTAGDGGDLGLEEDPFAEGSDPLAGGGDNPENKEEEVFVQKVSFQHKVRTLVGGSITRGLSVIMPEMGLLKEYRLVTTYEQSVKVQTSPRMYNYARISIDFAQNYEMNTGRFVDSYLSLREIYTNYRKGAHQIRYGTQIFKLGRVDFDRTIDMLHLSNVGALNTLSLESSKQALPAIKYTWLGGRQIVSVYLSPVQQQTVGMRFTNFRKEVENQQEDKKRKSESFLRDYYGVQYQWVGGTFDTRISFFHWYDASPKMSWDYERYLGISDNLTGESSFANLANSYNEEESRSNFATFEMDAAWDDMVWKMDAGVFDNKNVYSYEVVGGDTIHLNTVNTRHVAGATSLERTFPFFFWLMIYSHRLWIDVPENTHLLLYENQSKLLQKTRNVNRQQVTGIAILKPTEEIRITFLGFKTFPFVHNGYMNLWTWDRFKDGSTWEVKLMHLETGYQAMLNNSVSTDQAFLSYTLKFLGG